MTLFGRSDTLTKKIAFHDLVTWILAVNSFMSNVLSGVDLCISYETHTSALLRYMLFNPAMMQHQTHLVSLTLIRDQFINLLKPIDLVNLKGLEFFVQSIDYIFAWCTYELMKIILCYLLLLTTLRQQTNMWNMKRTS